MKLSTTMTGGAEVARAFLRLPMALALRVEKQCVAPAAKIVESAIRSNTPRGTAPDSGLTQKSVGVRMRMYRKTGTALAIVGMRRGENWRGRRPTNIVWLLEHGHRIAVGGTLKRESGKRDPAKSKRTGKAGEGKSAGKTRGRHMVEDAFRQTESQVRSSIDSNFPAALEAAVREAANG